MNAIKYNQLSIFDRYLFRDLSICIIIVFGSFLIIQGDYLIFHTLAESVSVIVSFILLSISLSTYRFNTNKSIIFLGIAYGFIGVFDLIHIFTYKDMGRFADITGNIPAQLWLVARYMEGISYFISFVLWKKRVNIRLKKAVFVYLFISIFLLVSILVLGTFPCCVLNGNKMTFFKIISEYIITGIFVIDTIYYIKANNNIKNRAQMFIILSLTTSAISEAFFSSHGAQLVSYGHIFKLISQYFIYMAFIKTSLEEPYIALQSLNETLMEKNKKLKELVRVQREEAEYRRKVENENLRKKQLLDGILESTMDGILMLDNDNNILHVNSQFMNMLNFPFKIAVNENTEEIVKHIRDNLINPEEFDIYRKESKNASVAYTSYIRLKNQKVIEVSTLPFIDRGQKSGTVIHLRDITDMEKIEELKRKVEVKKELLKKAKEIDDMKTSFFNTISHEIRTPLNVILSIIQLLDYEDKNRKDGYYVLPEVSVKALQKNSYRLIKLADNLIDITKIDSGQMNLDLHNYDMVKIIRDITYSAAEYIKKGDITIRFESNTDEKIMACDAQKIERVLLNLISNAIKFSESKADILVSFEDRKETVIIRVKDNGMGIPSHMIDTIFDRLKQVDSSLSRVNEGIGIGLTIVKSIVKMHGGDISVKSKEGEESEFIIELPVNIVKENNRVYADTYMGIDRVNIEFSDIYGIN